MSPATERRQPRVGFCECGCGEQTTNRFCRGHASKKRARERVRWVVEDRGHATPCHIWQLSRDVKGYGFEWDAELGRMNRAHILAYRRECGPVPAGKELDHLCRQRDCVNPGHLEAVTHAENIRRAAVLGAYKRRGKK